MSMRPAKKVTVSAMAIALGTIFLTVGAMWEVLDLSLAAISSLLVAFIFIEIGSPYTFIVWLATSLLSLIFFPGSVVWIEYFLIFGIYPIVKAYIERAPRILWWILKIAFANVVVLAMIFLIELITGLPFFASELWYLNVGLYILINAAFVAYDIFLTILIRAYMSTYRQKFRKFLK